MRRRRLLLVSLLGATVLYAAITHSLSRVGVRGRVRACHEQLRRAGVRNYRIRLDRTGKGWIDLRGNAIADLSPLARLPVQDVDLAHCSNVVSLAPLAGLPLKVLDLTGCRAVASVAPLRGMPLRHLWLADSGVTDLAPLEGMPLEYLSFPVDRVTNGLPVIRGMTALRGIASQSADRWALPPAEFWSRYDRGEFGATPAPRRVETSDPGKSSWLEIGEVLPAFRAGSAR